MKIVHFKSEVKVYLFNEWVVSVHKGIPLSVDGKRLPGRDIIIHMRKVPEPYNKLSRFLVKVLFRFHKKVNENNLPRYLREKSIIY